MPQTQTAEMPVAALSAPVASLQALLGTARTCGRRSPVLVTACEILIESRSVWVISSFSEFGIEAVFYLLNPFRERDVKQPSDVAR